MFSLLMLSLMLSAPTAADQSAVVSNDPSVVPTPPVVLVQQESPLIIEQEPVQSFDALQIHPESDICYRIRAFIFSEGTHPKFLRETTCGPKAPTARQTDGFKPGLVPLNVREKATDPPQK